MRSTSFKNGTLESVPTTIEFTSTYDVNTKTAWFKCHNNELTLRNITSERYEKIKHFLILTSLCFRVDGWNAACRLQKSNHSKLQQNKKEDVRNEIFESLGFYILEDI